MRVKVLNRLTTDAKNEQGKEFLDELHDLTYQLVIWNRIVPFRKGIEEAIETYYRIISETFKLKNAIVLIPTNNEEKELIALELDLLADGTVYDVFYLSNDDGEFYAEVEPMRYVEREEFEANDMAQKIKQRMLDSLKN